MHTYICTNSNGETLYVVGHYVASRDIGDTWRPLRAFTEELDASNWVSFLNGGTYPAAQVSEVQS